MRSLRLAAAAFLASSVWWVVPPCSIRGCASDCMPFRGKNHREVRNCRRVKTAGALLQGGAYAGYTFGFIPNMTEALNIDEGTLKLKKLLLQRRAA